MLTYDHLFLALLYAGAGNVFLFVCVGSPETWRREFRGAWQWTQVLLCAWALWLPLVALALAQRRVKAGAMRAGPHIKAMIEQNLEMASECRKMAKEIPEFADILLRGAEIAERDARQWANGTDYQIKNTE